MAKKILITSGDSWTAGSIGGINALRQSAPHPFILKDAVSFKNEEKLWPEILAEKLGWRYLNVARAGSGNEYIYSSMIDALTQVKNVGLAICLWSHFNRWCFPNESIKVDPKNPDKFSTFLTDRIKKNPDLVKELYRNGVANTIFENCERMLDEGNMKSVEEYNIFKGLRWFDAFQNFCICHDIPFMHAGAFYPIESYYEDLITSKRIESFFMHPLYDYIKEENFVGWPIFTRLGGFTMSSLLDWKDPERTLLRIGHTRSSDLGGQGDMHPNEAGHELISEVFYEHYKKLR